MAQGWSHGPVGAVVAAWPTVSLVGSYELLVWLIRTSGPAARGPSAVHPCKGAACRAVVHPLPAPAVDGERPGGSEPGTSDPAWRPAGQAAEALVRQADHDPARRRQGQRCRCRIRGAASRRTVTDRLTSPHTAVRLGNPECSAGAVPACPE